MNEIIKASLPWANEVRTINSSDVPVINGKKITWKTRGSNEFYTEKKIALEAAKDLYGKKALSDLKEIVATSEKEWLQMSSKIMARYRHS